MIDSTPTAVTRAAPGSATDHAHPKEHSVSPTEAVTIVAIALGAGVYGLPFRTPSAVAAAPAHVCADPHGVHPARRRAVHREVAQRVEDVRVGTAFVVALRLVAVGGTLASASIVQ